MCVAGLSWERDALLARSIERVERELDAGVVDEVRRALARGISRTASQALGVKEIVEHIEGRLTLAEATEVLMRNTKGFVRRQLSWFGTDPRVEWVGVSALGWEGARDRIVRRFSGVLAGDQ